MTIPKNRLDHILKISYLNVLNILNNFSSIKEEKVKHTYV